MNSEQFYERLEQMPIDESDWEVLKGDPELIDAFRDDFESIPVPPFNFDAIEREALWKLEESLGEHREPGELCESADEDDEEEDEIEIPGLIDGPEAPEEGVDEDVMIGGIEIIQQKLRGSATVASLINWYQGERGRSSHPEVAEAVRAAIIRLMLHKFMQLFEEGLNEGEQQEIISLAKPKADKGDDLFNEVLRKIGISVDATKREQKADE